MAIPVYTPTTGTPAADVVALERVAARGWAPDEVDRLPSGWLLRAAEGFTGRANSALVVADPGDELDSVLADVVTWYRDRGLPARVSVPLPAFDDLEAALSNRGWTPRWGAHVMVRQLDGLAPGSDGPRVEVSPDLTAAWAALYHYLGADLPAVAARVLARGDHVGFASVRDGEETVAVARGAVTDDWLGIAAVETSPSHRRRGLATALLGTLAQWARAQGATRTYLQVDLANGVARQMYERAGFVIHHHYHYLELPDTEARRRR